MMSTVIAIRETYLTPRGVHDMFGEEALNLLDIEKSIVVLDKPAIYALVVTDQPGTAKYLVVNIEQSLVDQWNDWRRRQPLFEPNQAYQCVPGREFLVSITNAGWLQSSARQIEFGTQIQALYLDAA